MSNFRKPISLLLSLILTIASISTMSFSALAAAEVPTDGQIYYIKNKNSGLYLQVENNSADNGANVCQSKGTGSLGQKWIINENSDGSVRLKSAVDMTGGVALDIPNGIADNLTNVQVWSSNGLTPQNFKLESNGDGSYAIKTAASGYERCLDVLDWSTSSGANVIQYDCFMADNQLWYFEEAGWPSSSSSNSKETTTETTTKAATQSSSSSSSSVSWNMGNTAFKNLGTISSNITVDGLTLLANSSKSMSVKSESASVNGTDFSYCLSLGGSGSTSYRAASATVSGSSTIKITARSSGSSTRTLNITDASGNVLSTISYGSTAALGTATINYNGKIYIYSADSGINIYKIQIDAKGSSSSSSSGSSGNSGSSSSSGSSTAQSKSWNMSNSSFKSLGTISSDTTVDGLKLIANSSKTMEVKADNATVNSTNYSYCLSLGGSGSKSYRAIALDISGTTNLKITARSSGSSTRTLNVADSSGNILGTISCGSTASLGSVALKYSGKVYIYSANSSINIYKVQIDTTGNLPSGSSSSNSSGSSSSGSSSSGSSSGSSSSGSSSSSTNGGNTVTSYSALVSAVKNLASTGGTIYVNAKELNCNSQLALNSTKGKTIQIIGVKQSDGTYPVLNFKSMRDSSIGTSAGSLKASGDSDVGVRITGSNYVLKNLIIEKAGDNGIQIKGSSANYNTIENCIVRYNNDAGLQITNGASYNTIRFVYSYRNCDVYTLGGNADGFAPKLGASTGNTFYGCYAWDNSDDGWDSFDKTDGYTKDLSYEQCACWNNGNPDVFTGKYDFDKGNSLDTDLFLVELISKQSSSFASNYKNGKFSLPSGNFIKTSSGTVSLSSWTGSNYDGNPNGFKFGSVNSGSSLKRTVKNCLAFDHGKKGFDNNNSSCTGSFTNCISFDNGYNYYLPTFTISKWSGIYGFSGSSSNKLPSGYSVSTPSSSTQASIRSKVESTRKSIVSKCNSNIIPGEVYFNIY